jgi:hypothetical protein
MIKSCTLIIDYYNCGNPTARYIYNILCWNFGEQVECKNVLLSNIVIFVFFIYIVINFLIYDIEGLMFAVIWMGKLNKNYYI